jgi:mannose-6-phosphate isomerase-like protein (cupin superfamily)
MPEYVIHDEPLIGTLERLDVPALIDSITDEWHNQTLCQVDSTLVRLGVLHGEYHWHKHDGEDEFFFVLSGHLRIELADRDPVDLPPGSAFIVPKGLRHRPICPTRTAVLMLERAGVTPTGD